MSAAPVRVVQHILIARLQMAFIFVQHQFDALTHGTQMHRHVGRVSNQVAAGVKNCAGEIQPFLDVDQGTLEMTVAEDTSLMPGTCTVPEHFNDPPVKDLMPLQIDPITGVPYFKLAYVTIEKV